MCGGFVRRGIYDALPLSGMKGLSENSLMEDSHFGFESAIWELSSNEFGCTLTSNSFKYLRGAILTGNVVHCYLPALPPLRHKGWRFSSRNFKFFLVVIFFNSMAMNSCFLSCWLSTPRTSMSSPTVRLTPFCIR